MKKILAFVLAAFVFAACGGGSKLDIKEGGKDSTLNIKSSGGYTSFKRFTDKEGKVTKATLTHIYLANYDLDYDMQKPLTAADQIRVGMALVGEEDKATFKTGTYRTSTFQNYNKLDWLSVSAFADGKETKTDFDMNFPQSKISGEVRITSVTDDSISGEIDVTDGDKSIKGSFTAKLPGKK
jgi:predicted small secreted protein